MSNNPQGYTLTITAFVECESHEPDDILACAARAGDIREEIHRMADVAIVEMKFGPANTGRRQFYDLKPKPNGRRSTAAD